MSLTNENIAIKFNIEDFDITQLSSPDMYKVEINNVYYNIFKKTYDKLATSDYVNRKIINRSLNIIYKVLLIIFMKKLNQM